MTSFSYHDSPFRYIGSVLDLLQNTARMVWKFLLEKIAGDIILTLSTTTSRLKTNICFKRHIPPPINSTLDAIRLTGMEIIMVKVGRVLANNFPTTCYLHYVIHSNMFLTPSDTHLDLKSATDE